MRMRHHYILNRQSLSDAGERTEDIRIQDPITELLIHFRMKNGTTNNRSNTVAENVSAIEVIDGSKVLFSLDGPELLALTADYYGFLPFQHLSEIPGAVQGLNVVIPFGRYQGDPVYGFNARAFINPQVRLVWDHSTIRDSTTDSFEDDGVSVSVMAKVMEEGPSFSRMLRTTQFKAWTTADGTLDYTNLPRDYPLRLMIIRAEVAAYGMEQLFETIRLNCDAGKFIPFDLRWIDYMQELMNRKPAYHYKHNWNLSNGDTGITILKQEEGVALGFSQGARTGYYNNYGIGEAAVGLRNEITELAITADENVFASITGWCPYRCVVHHFGDPQDPATWFPAPDYGSMRLELTGETVAASATLCVQEEYAY